MKRLNIYNARISIRGTLLPRVLEINAFGETDGVHGNKRTEESVVSQSVGSPSVSSPRGGILATRARGYFIFYTISRRESQRSNGVKVSLSLDGNSKR